MLDQKLKQSLRDVLARHHEVRLAILFGSVARGTARDDSDLDLAVDTTADLNLGELAAELSLAAEREVDLVSLRDPGVPLLEELLRDGVVVHERDHAAGLWRAKVLSDLEVDRPWYGRMRDAWLTRVAERGLGDGQP